MNKKFIFLGFAALIIFAIYGQINARKHGRESFKKFNESNIDGIINEVKRCSKSTCFSLEDGSEYEFHPFILYKKEYDYDKSELIFLWFAQKGDSVVKPAFSDKLYLIRNGKKYAYRFIIIPY